MEKLDPSMRLKVKRDTFYLPEQNKGVYLRNNAVSFRLEGSGIDLWVEKLLPMFNGEYTLEKLTDGLPGPYKKRVYEIAEVLYQNGFVRDVSQDQPHELQERVLKKFASQIEFVDNLAGSGAFRFEAFRQANVLAVGSGPILHSLISSLLESGVAKLNVFITDDAPTNRKRLNELVNHACKTDPEVVFKEITMKDKGWREVLEPFDTVLYVSQEGNLEELRYLHSVCREENKSFIPGILLEQVGIAGPCVHPESDLCWESAWRRLHSSVLEKEQPIPARSATTGALLANIISFELLKEKTGVTKADQNNRVFLLDLETLEGSWHSVLPHPLVTDVPTAKRIEDIESRFEQDANSSKPEKLLQFFSHMTSQESGILHLWEEGDLKQLPLAQCRVQAVDPLSDGPAELMGERVCSAFTHEEARREAALTGIEQYSSRLASLLQSDDFIGVGAGETFVEGVGRGLQKCLADQFSKRSNNQREFITCVDLETVGDEWCQYYLNALATMHGAPNIGLGKEVSGFPVVWVETRYGWHGSVDLNVTLALRRSLQQALFTYQNHSVPYDAIVLDESALQLDDSVRQSFDIPACAERIQLETLQEATEVLNRNGMQIFVYELRIEPFFKQELEGVFGVLLREEGMN